MIVVILQETHISPHAWTFDRRQDGIDFAKWPLDQYEDGDFYTRHDEPKPRGDLIYSAWLEDDGASVAVYDCPHNAPKPWDDHVELP